MHVLLFDIDGTLIASGGAGKAALEEAMAAEFGVAHSIEKLQLSGRTDRAIAADLLAGNGIEASADNWSRLRAAYLRQLPACLARSRGRILPGIEDLLNLAAARGDVALGLLTGNIRDGARVKLGHFGLFHHFAFGGFGDHHLDRNDVAREALAAVREHVDGKTALDRIWVIGDTPLDVQCARAIGVRVLAVATGWHPVEELADYGPDLVLADLYDPSPLVRLLA